MSNMYWFDRPTNDKLVVFMNTFLNIINIDLSLFHYAVGDARCSPPGLLMEWDGTKKFSHGTNQFISFHPMGFHGQL